MSSKTEIVYHYRGGVERGARYDWRDGYSEQGEHGPLYPWMTKRECQAEACKRSARAVFMRDGKREGRTRRKAQP